MNMNDDEGYSSIARLFKWYFSYCCNCSVVDKNFNWQRARAVPLRQLSFFFVRFTETHVLVIGEPSRRSVELFAKISHGVYI